MTRLETKVDFIITFLTAKFPEFKVVKALMDKYFGEEK